MLKCHSLLDHTVFTWYCDHANARYMMTAKTEHQRVARLALWLSMYYFNLVHLRGKHVLLQIVDAISRLNIPDDPDDREVFSPFEVESVQKQLSTMITKEAILCERRFELTTDTHAELTRLGIDVVPDRPTTAFMRTWSFRMAVKVPRPLKKIKMPTASSEEQLLCGMELYGSFLTPSVAMVRSGIEVVAVVECDEELVETMREGVTEVSCAHYHDVEALRIAILQCRVELPQITVMHANLVSE